MWYKSDAEGLTIYVYAQPGAKSTAIVGIHDDALKIRLNTPAVEGRANDALLKFIAQLFDVPLRQVKLVRGDKIRRKTLRIIGSVVEPSKVFSN
ncbi:MULTISPECIES: DUF167 domain-containing protein [Legionella]|uniref:UPF0235 protein Ldro_1969 n=1 Tax=Legionella drozanskii LLAP-1 TaxID=1212489 RepID=A0A0W0SQZ4_9GAMM|nr:MULTISPECIES: DUF167 domain-containing protein [Legionella]KTC85644.1 hypothetical protein Ldro_1969 [Legionella drozanskii LLAP-1]PJE15151.1 MAG: YggU family protein [Legionella sp.]